MLVVDLSEWCSLAMRLETANQDRLNELIAALRRIVEAEEKLAAVVALTSSVKSGQR